MTAGSEHALDLAIFCGWSPADLMALTAPQMRYWALEADALAERLRAMQKST